MPLHCLLVFPSVLTTFLLGCTVLPMKYTLGHHYILQAGVPLGTTGTVTGSHQPALEQTALERCWGTGVTLQPSEEGGDRSLLVAA